MKTPEQRAEEAYARMWKLPDESPDDDFLALIAAAIRDALADADREALGAACPVSEEAVESVRESWDVPESMVGVGDLRGVRGDIRMLLAALDYYRALAAALAREQGLDQQVRAAYAAGLREGRRRCVEAALRARGHPMEADLGSADVADAVEAVSEEP